MDLNKIITKYKNIDALTSKPYLNGVNYIKFAMDVLKETPTAINEMTRVLYPTIAIYFDTTKSAVERAMYYAKQYFYVAADAKKTTRALLYYLYVNVIN